VEFLTSTRMERVEQGDGRVTVYDQQRPRFTTGWR
jgi:hypothetical protein